MREGTFWLASYPKSGNTWLRAFLANLLSEIDGPVHINELQTGNIASARQWIDDVLGFDTADLTAQEVLRFRPSAYAWLFNEAGKYAYHKIHDAYVYQNDMPVFGGNGVRGAIYILRNPLDVAISNAHHSGVDIDRAISFMADPTHSISRSEHRLADQLTQPLQTWSQHVLSWVDAREIPVYVIRYEDMHAESHTAFTGAAQFLRLPHEPERIDRALSMASFDELRQQEQQSGFKERSPFSRSFFRKGIVGDWRDTLSVAQIDRIISDHFDVMRRFGYIDEDGVPTVTCSTPTPM